MTPTPPDAQAPGSEELRRQLQNTADHWRKCLAAPGWTPRRSHIEDCANAFQMAANNVPTPPGPEPSEAGKTTSFSKIEKGEWVWLPKPDHKTHLVSDDYAQGYREGRAVELKQAKIKRPLPVDRDFLGRIVREAWIRWAETQDAPKAHWLLPYSELSEPDKEADRQIGEALVRWVLDHDLAATRLSSLSAKGETKK